MANGVAQIRRSVMTLALPVTVSSLLQRTEGIVAVFLVGGLGAIPIAAVGLGQLLAFIATTLVSGLSVVAFISESSDAVASLHCQLRSSRALTALPAQTPWCGAAQPLALCEPP